MLGLGWAVLWSITGKESLPGGSLFGVLVLFYSAIIGGEVLRHFQLPPLLGMLIAGFAIRNAPVVQDMVHIKETWSKILRNIALSIILVRSGLGLESKDLKENIFVWPRLALIPCLVEAGSSAALAHYLMNLPWKWGLIVGFALGAVSPAVLVPTMIAFQEQGHGVKKGVPTLLMAACSFEDIIALTGLNICLGIAFPTDLPLNIVLKASLEVVVGVAAGLFIGVFTRYFPNRRQRGRHFKRAYLLLGLGICAIFNSPFLGFPASGGVCVLIMTIISGFGWDTEKDDVEEIIAVAWNIFEPLLFGLIGAAVPIQYLKPKSIEFCLATVGSAMLIRMVTTFFVMLFAGFDFKEKVFICFAWIPKATVQAAIGPVALDTARVHDDERLEEYGVIILTIAFLAILITAPIGSLLINLLGPRMLEEPEEIDNKAADAILI